MLYLFLIFSVLLFILMGYDKRLAQMGGYRIPEKALLTLGVLGGALGGLIGMRVFKHKTCKAYFRIIFLAALAIQLYLLIQFQPELLNQIGL